MKNAIASVFEFSLIGLCALSMVFQTQFLVEKRLNSFDYALFLGCLTLFGYHFQQGPRSKRWQAWPFGAVAGFLFFYENWSFRWEILAVGLVGLAYFLPPTRFSLRAQTFGKPIFIAFVWSFLTAFIPAKSSGAWPLEAVGWLSGGRFFFIAALALGYDLIDRPIDFQQNLATLPVRFGSDFAKKVGWVLLVCAAGCSARLWWLGFYSSKTWIALSISWLATAFLLEKITVGPLLPRAKMWVDGLMVFQFLVLLIF